MTIDSPVTNARLASLESKVASLDLQTQRLLNEQHAMDKQLVEIRSDLKYIKSGQDSLNNNLAKVLWLFGGVFVTSFGVFILKGGFNVLL
jgi:TolA-binding protein